MTLAWPTLALGGDPRIVLEPRPGATSNRVAPAISRAIDEDDIDDEIGDEDEEDEDTFFDDEEDDDYDDEDDRDDGFFEEDEEKVGDE